MPEAGIESRKGVRPRDVLNAVRVGPEDDERLILMPGDGVSFPGTDRDVVVSRWDIAFTIPVVSPGRQLPVGRRKGVPGPGGDQIIGIGQGDVGLATGVVTPCIDLPDIGRHDTEPVSSREIRVFITGRRDALAVAVVPPAHDRARGDSAGGRDGCGHQDEDEEAGFPVGFFQGDTPRLRGIAGCWYLGLSMIG